MSVFDIIAHVQRSDLNAEEEDVKAEREKRRLLRLQANSASMSIGELLTKITGATEEKPEAPKVEETPHVAAKAGGFPPPPNGPTSASG